MIGFGQLKLQMILEIGSKMNFAKLKIRLEEKEDFAAVENITREAFWNLYCPGCNEHYLIHTLRKSEAFIPKLDYVAEYQGKVIGNIVYAKAEIIHDNGAEIDVITFGPVSVHPDYQGMGIGHKLITYSLDQARKIGYKAVFILGDPDYYQKYGFKQAEEYDIALGNNMYLPALQAFELEIDFLKDVHGCFHEGKDYKLDEEEVIEFDKNFSPKELLKNTPSQLKFMEQVKMMKPREIKN